MVTVDCALPCLSFQQRALCSSQECLLLLPSKPNPVLPPPPLPPAKQVTPARAGSRKGHCLLLPLALLHFIELTCSLFMSLKTLFIDPADSGSK